MIRLLGAACAASALLWTGTLNAQSAAPGAKPGLERQEIRAQLLPRRYTTIAAEIGARVNRLPVSEGNAFRAGQLLVSFDCTLQQAQLRKAQAELESAELTLKSNQRLAELNSVGQLELDLSRSAVSKARAEIGAHQAVLSKCGVSAPFAGRVAEQKVREQQYVQPGQRYPAKFIRIGARVDPVSQSVKVAAAIDGKFSELIAGMSGRVQITPP